MPQQDVQAIEWMHRMLAVAEWPIPRLYLAALLALNGKEAEARESVKKYLSLKNIEVRSIRALEAWLYLWSDTPHWTAYVNRLSEGLRKAGMPEE